MNQVNLADFAGGILQEKFKTAFQEVVENMQNPNTPYKNKRGITIKISFEQNERRNDSEVEVKVETKLTPVSPVKTSFSIGKDLETGEVYAEEYGKQIKGQMSFEDIKPEQQVDEETSGIEDNRVVDFKKQA